MGKWDQILRDLTDSYGEAYLSSGVHVRFEEIDSPVKNALHSGPNVKIIIDFDKGCEDADLYWFILGTIKQDNKGLINLHYEKPNFVSEHPVPGYIRDIR